MNKILLILFIFISTSLMSYSQVLTAPPLKTPANYSIVNSTTVSFSWDTSPSSSPVKYHWEVYKNGTSNLIWADSGSEQVGLSRSGFEWNTTYYWRVRGRNLNGFGIWSSFWNFTIKNLIGTNVTNSSIAYYTLQNYPNPFNPSTTIVYSLENESLVKIEVYDVIGRLTSTLVNEIQARGNYRTIFNASNLTNGMYIIKYTNNTSVKYIKCSLLK